MNCIYSDNVTKLIEGAFIYGCFSICKASEFIHTLGQFQMLLFENLTGRVPMLSKQIKKAIDAFCKKNSKLTFYSCIT